jgi:Fe-S cluster assembly ATP-binding protein
MLKVDKLRVKLGQRLVLQGVSLNLRPGEVIAIMGPNGSGKTSLAFSLIGHPSYRVVAGKLELDGKSLLPLPMEERVNKGLFLGWQTPIAVRGVTLEQLLRVTAINCQNLACRRTGQEERCLPLAEFRQVLRQEMKRLNLDESCLQREINLGFSGGEKKKLELLQLSVLKPRYAVLDEIDSGLDIDALALVGKRINELRKEIPDLGLVLITHYRRILEYIKPDRVGVMISGRLQKWGAQDLILRLEKEGYAGFN